jgi:hypothetical protein
VFAKPAKAYIGEIEIALENDEDPSLGEESARAFFLRRGNNHREMYCFLLLQYIIYKVALDQKQE